MSLIIIFFLLLFSIFFIFFITTILRYLNIISSKISRKIIHIFIAPIFLFFIPFFPNNFSFRFFLSSLPIIISFLFYFSVKNKNFFSNIFCLIMSRSGEIKEILNGPFFYGIIVGLITFIYYINEPIGVISIINLCFGDGFADLIGSFFNSKVIFSPFGKKTFYGCFSFVFFSFLMGCVFCKYLFDKMFVFNNFLLAIVGCFSEFFSSPKFDNIFIVLGVCFVGKFLSWK
jgi:dolichol kinase